MKPHVFLCMPSYDGQVNADAAREFWCAGSKDVQVTNWTAQGSLLPHVFNCFWAQCVSTKVDKGYTHWAMQHADVVPEPGWLGIMLREMESSGADVLAAAVRIKDNSGLTSTAIEHNNLPANGHVPYPRRRPFRHLHRVAVLDFSENSPTSTADQIIRGKNGKLLLNTGLMLVNRRTLDLFSEKQITPFNLYSKIDYSTNPPQVRTESEDWHFSRRCHMLGLKLCVTTAVEVKHVGQYSWGSNDDSDEDTDQEHQAVSLVDVL